MTEAASQDTLLDLVRAANDDGERALADRDIAAADRAFTTALEHLGLGAGWPDLAVTAHVGLGRVGLARNDFKAADLRFDQVQRLRPASPAGYYWAGCTAAHARNHARAEWLLSAALDRDAKHGRAYLQRAYVRLRRCRPELALADLQAAIDRGAGNDNALLLMVALRARPGQVEQAVSAVLDGRRDDAIKQLARAATQSPADHRISHAQAVLLLHTLGSAEPNRADPSRADWHDCIGAWVSVLHDEDFWTRWQSRAGQRYGGRIPQDTINAARTALDEFIEARLPSDELALLLRRERAAAAVLARLGGLPDPDPTRPPLVCGPLRIAELGLQQRLGEFVIGLPPTEAGTVEMARQFSEIGRAMALLDAGRPRAAATAALDLRCASCAATGGRTHPAMIAEPLMCEPECPEFDRRNPAFCALADKYGGLAKASAELAARTLLDIARADITEATMDLADARTCWRGAVTLAKRFSRREAILREIVDNALGRARFLSGRSDLTGAIDVLDAVLATIPTKDAGQRDRVSTELGFLLNRRGVGLFNADTANAQAALRDLRRAVALGPHRPQPRFNLAMVLREMAYLARHDLAESIRLMSESVEQFAIGAAEHDTEKFHRELELARQELDRLLEQYRGRSADGDG